jgi:hypothetical protein
VADSARVDALGVGTGFSKILGGTITGDGNDFGAATVNGLIVQAQSSEEIFHLAVAGGFGFVGVSGGVAVTLIDSDTAAFIGANALINQADTDGDGILNEGAGLNQSVYVNASNKVRTTSFAGALAVGFVGVGGAVDVGSIKNDTTAKILGGAHVTAVKDVAVNAVAIQEVDGFTIGGAGGFVGITASVSVWSVGTPLQRDYSDNEGRSSNAVQGENGAADQDAANQAGAAQAQVGSLLAGYGEGSSGGSDGRVTAVTESAASRLNASGKDTSYLAGRMSDPSGPAAGTVAGVESGAVITAGEDIEVTANVDMEVDITTGAAAAGFVGVGAAIAVTHVAAAVNAYAGGTLTAGGNIGVKAILDDDVNVRSYAGAAGFVGLGASVVVVQDASTVAAYIANNAEILSANSVSVTATNDQYVYGRAGQVAVGAVGAGASFVKISVDNRGVTDTRAFVGSNVNIGQSTGVVGSLSVSAVANTTARAETFAISAGIGAFSANFALVEITPEVQATIGSGSRVTVAGAVTVSATATPKGYGKTFGVNAGVLAVGMSLADVEASLDVRAAVAGTLSAGSLTVRATQAVPSSDHSAQALTTGSAGGLIGIDATLSKATNRGSTRSYVENSATLNVTGTTTILALGSTSQRADANSNTAGLIASGTSASHALSSTTTEAYLGTNVDFTGGGLNIIAAGNDYNFADTVAGSAGLVAGASAWAKTTSTSTTTAKINGRTVTGKEIDLTGPGSGSLVVKAEHTAAFNSRVRALSGGLFAGLGAEIDNIVTSNVTAAVGASSVVLAKDIQIEAINRTDKPFLGTPNISGTSGGFITDGGADSYTLLNLTTIVDIAPNALLSVVGSVHSPGQIVLRALNDITAKDKVAFTAGGAVAGLSANTRIETANNLSRVQIGTGARLSSIGEINVFSRGQGNVAAAVEAEAYGVGTYTAALAEALIHPHNEIVIAGGAVLHAKGDLNLYAGTGPNFVRDQYTIDARSDTFAGSAIPIDDVNSTTAKVTYNTITVEAGSLVETAGKARLHAEKEGFADLSGSAKAVSWVSAVQDWLNGAAAAQMNDATIFQEGHGIVRVDGTVRTGIERQKELILTGWDNATGTITGYTQKGDVTFTSAPEVVQSDLVQELAFAQEQLNLYGETNATLKAFYEAEIARIKARMEAEGIVDPDSPVPLTQYAIHVHVDPMTAEAAPIDVRADVLTGGGQLDAPGDASVNIQNHTPAFLVIHGITIPESTGGVYLNGAPVTTNSMIHASNLVQVNEDNSRTGPGDSTLSAPMPQFSEPLPNSTGAPEPWVVIHNDFTAGHVGPSETYPWPDITVVGTVSNLGGLVHIETKPSGEGDVNIFATVEAKTLEIVAGGTVFVDLGNVEGSRFNTGSEPYAIWGDITRGVLPGDSSGTLYDGLAAADPTAMASLLSQVPTTPSISGYGDRIYITAEYINLNGLLQSGRDSYTLTLGAATATEIASLGNAAGLVVLTNADVAQSRFNVRYNTISRQIEVDDMRTSGGYIDLTGHILNTGNGIVRALGGYPDVEITNNTDYDLVLYKVDVSEPGYGTVIIKDKARGTPGNPYVTIYREKDGVVTRTEDDGPGGAATSVTTVGKNSQYTLADGWRYGWSVGAETFDRYYYHHDTTAWIGIDWLSADPATITWDSHEVLNPPPKLIKDSAYYYRDASIADPYTFHYPGAQELSGDLYIIDNHVDSTWYGKKTYHNEVKYESRNLHVFTHTIEADRPVAIQFTGDDEGGVDIYSRKDVVLRGPVLNPSGTTGITAGDEIRQEGDEARVTGRRIELTAANGIGEGTPIQTDVSIGAGAAMKALTTTGDIQIREKAGDLPVDSIVTGRDSLGSGGKVVVSSPGSIGVGRSREGVFHEGLIQGGAIDIQAGTGGVGTLDRPLILDSGALPRDRVEIVAGGGVYITEKAGDLHLKGIRAGGDVHIGVVSGGIVDAEESETRDERTYEELKAGVWHDLQLTASTGAASKVQAAKDSLAAIKTQEYKTYWSYRLTQDHNPLSSIQTSSLAGIKYYVIVDGEMIRLAATAADAMRGKSIDIDAASAAGTGHGLSTSGTGFDARTAVDGAADTLTIPGHGFATGDSVTYSQEGRTAAVGLSAGVTYYVEVVDANTLRLKTDSGGRFTDSRPLPAGPLHPGRRGEQLRRHHHLGCGPRPCHGESRLLQLCSRGQRPPEGRDDTPRGRQDLLRDPRGRRPGAAFRHRRRSCPRPGQRRRRRRAPSAFLGKSDLGALQPSHGR